MPRIAPWCCAALLTVLLAGCSNTNTPEAGVAAEQSSSTGSEPASSANAEPSASAAEVPLRLAAWDEVEGLVAAEKDKVVVLDVWSTWCTPCIREFPHLVALHRKYDGRVACYSVNCNYTGAEGETPEDARSEIAAFLNQQGAAFTNVISTTPDQELLTALGAASAPIVRVYDKQGQLRKQFTNDDGEYGDEGFSYEGHIQPLVDQLLAE